MSENVKTVTMPEPEPEPEPVPVGQRREQDGTGYVLTDKPGGSPWVLYKGDGISSCSHVFVSFENGWEIVTDATEVPEDVIEAAAEAIADDLHACGIGGPWTAIDCQRYARTLADAGLLVGTVPKLPEGHHVVDLSGVGNQRVSDFSNLVYMPEFSLAFRAEAERRGL